MLLLWRVEKERKWRQQIQTTLAQGLAVMGREDLKENTGSREMVLHSFEGECF